MTRKSSLELESFFCQNKKLIFMKSSQTRKTMKCKIQKEEIMKEISRCLVKIKGKKQMKNRKISMGVKEYSPTLKNCKLMKILAKNKMSKMIIMRPRNHINCQKVMLKHNNSA